jgi:hypothetical protein
MRGPRTQHVPGGASHGYVVLTIDHPSAASGVRFPDGRLVEFDARLLPPWPRYAPDDPEAALLDSVIPFLADDVHFVALARPATGVARRPLVRGATGSDASAGSCLSRERERHACATKPPARHRHRRRGRHHPNNKGDSLAVVLERLADRRGRSLLGRHRRGVPDSRCGRRGGARDRGAAAEGRARDGAPGDGRGPAEDARRPGGVTGATVRGPAWVHEVCDFQTVPVFVRPGSVLPIGARDDRPHYPYDEDVTLRAPRVRRRRPDHGSGARDDSRSFGDLRGGPRRWHSDGHAAARHRGMAVAPHRRASRDQCGRGRASVQPEQHRDQCPGGHRAVLNRTVRARLLGSSTFSGMRSMRRVADRSRRSAAWPAAMLPT